MPPETTPAESSAATGGKLLLEATGVAKAFGSFLAVAGADVRVAEGEIIGLIGPNGAGKSTFFNCLAGDTLPSAGRIMFDGADLTRASPEAHARAGIGRTFQVPTTFEDMTVLHNVMVGAFLRHPHRSDARDQARRIVELTGLRADQPARSLGTPGRKRLEIARVLATEPRLLLLDESLAGLTPSELQEAIALVRRIHQRGVTIVIVEHIMEVIMTLTKRVLVFNQGRVIASGTPEAVVREEAVIEAYLGRAHRRAPADPSPASGGG
jgi:branched-chain amino acid transport system ATP-binding protein